MATKRIGAWTGRLVALLAAVIIPACGSMGSPGGANPNGILWQSQGTGTPQGGVPGGSQLWVDPNSGLGASQIGISNIVVSTDDATYDGYFPSGTVGLASTQIIYSFGWLKPLSTDTGSTAITSRENTLQGLINGYRQQQLGNVGAGGANGNGGGVAVGNVTGIILAGHFKGTKSVRAHCKYYALGYGAGNFAAGPNQEGDDLQTTDLNNVRQNGFMVPTPAGSLGNAYGQGSTLAGTLKNPDGDQGRLGKVGVVAYLPTFATADFTVAGPGYGEADSVFQYFLRTYPGRIAVTGPTNFAIGHWRGGGQAYYWDMIFLMNPTPAN